MRVVLRERRYADLGYLLPFYRRLAVKTRCIGPSILGWPAIYSLAQFPKMAIPRMAGELQSPGTGPFFGEKTHFAKKRMAENMDLSPSRQDFTVLLVVPGGGLTGVAVEDRKGRLWRC